MDGIFIAFHNTAKIFGFQYLSIEDMDKPLFGSKLAGDRAFSKSVELLDSLADVIARVSHGKASPSTPMLDSHLTDSARLS